MVFLSCSKDNEPNENIEFVDERLSAAVTYRHSGQVVSDFLNNPTMAYISGYFKFPADLPIDVIFGLDIEWFEGLNNSICVPGGDWMAFAGFTQTGHLWVPVGSPENLTGTPTFADNFEVFDSQGELTPDTWYQMTIRCNYATKEFISVGLTGADLDVEFDLSGKQLEYPNYVAFDNPSLTMYCFASRSVALSSGNNLGNTKVYFDDLEAGIWNGSSYDIILSNSFENPAVLNTAPYDFSADSNPINEVLEGRWYNENPEARLTFVDEHARTGNFALECDASLIQ